MYVCMYVCMYVFMYVCMYLCVNACLQCLSVWTYDELRTIFSAATTRVDKKILLHSCAPCGRCSTCAITWGALRAPRSCCSHRPHGKIIFSWPVGLLHHYCTELVILDYILIILMWTLRYIHVHDFIIIHIDHFIT